MRIGSVLLIFFAFQMLISAGSSWGAGKKSAVSSLESLPTADQVRAQQSLGRVVISPDARFFLFEWSKPYSFFPKADGIPSKAAKRMETSIFLVNAGATPATAEYLLLPNPRSTYYLGALSPSASRVALYELNRETNEARLGVATVDYSMFPKITWFTVPVDSDRLDSNAVWISDDELIYPTRSAVDARAKFSRAVVSSAEVQPCMSCKAVAAPFTVKDAPAEPAGALARIPGSERGKTEFGSLVVTAVDTAEELSLYFRKDNVAHRVFANDRRSGKFVAQTDIDIGVAASRRTESDSARRPP